MDLRRIITFAGFLLIALSTLAAPASASFSVDSPTASPTDPRAAAHSNFTIAFQLGGDEKIKDLDVELPPGLVGNPNATSARCTEAQLASDGCPAASTVGSTTIQADATLILVPVPITAQGTVYNVVPHAGEPARLGIVVRPMTAGLGNIVLQSPVSVRSTSDFGLTSILRDMPQTSLGLPIDVNAISLTLNADASSGKFMTNPTSCGPNTTRFRASSYSGTVRTASASFTTTDCAGVPFTPTLAVTPATTAADTPSAYDAVLGVPGTDSAGRAQANVRRARVVLPPGTGLNAPLGQGLEPCSDGQFGRGSDPAPTCPAASDIGDATINTPLLGTLAGNVYLGAPAAGDPFRLFVAIPLPGGWIKLPGSVSPDPATGQLTTTFAGLPAVPFTEFKLSFRGGDRGVLVNDVACGPQRSSAALEPYSGGAERTPASEFATTGCGDPQPFAPTFAAASSDLRAGASPQLTMEVARAPGQQLLNDLEISMPAGLVGGVSGIGLCIGDAAQTGNCPADSRVGTATAVSGAGGDPLRLTGGIYLSTGTDGATASLISVIPAKVGPYDFGNAVVRSNIRVRAGDAGFEVAARGLPQILGGIPLRLRGLSLRLDRQGFLRNPTACDARQIEARFTSTRGARSSASSPYQATGCEALPFAPRLSAVAGGAGNTGRGAHPMLTATVEQAPGEAATKTVRVELPPQLGVDQAQLTHLCQPEQALAHTCPPESKIGDAEALTPLLPLPLTGSVYMTANQGGLPRLTADLQGLLALQLTGDVGYARGIVNTFDGIPDVPLSRFVLRFGGGPGGALVAQSDLCTARGLEMKGTFTGHSGATSTSTSQLRIEGCSARGDAATPTLSAVVTRLASGRPTVTLKVRRAADGAKLKNVAVTLPPGLTFDAAAVRRGLSGKAGNRRVSVRGVSVKGRKLTIAKLPSKTADVLRLVLSRGAVVADAKLKARAKRRPKLAFVARVVDAKGARFTVKRSVRAR
jgi:hypothetical protein